MKKWGESDRICLAFGCDSMGDGRHRGIAPIIGRLTRGRVRGVTEGEQAGREAQSNAAGFRA